MGFSMREMCTNFGSLHVLLKNEGDVYQYYVTAILKGLLQAVLELGKHVDTSALPNERPP